MYRLDRTRRGRVEDFRHRAGLSDVGLGVEGLGLKDSGVGFRASGSICTV